MRPCSQAAVGFAILPARHRQGTGGIAKLAPLVQNLDAPLGVLEPRVAEARQLDAPLVELEGLLERRRGLVGLRMTNAPPVLRHFTAEFAELA